MRLFRRSPKPEPAPEMRPDTRFRAATHVAAAAQGERTVLLDHKGGEYYGLDEVGTRIWQLVGEERSVAGIVDALETEYDAPRETLEADVRRILSELEKLGVVARG